jgi:predicted nucleotidyltransferase
MTMLEQILLKKENRKQKLQSALKVVTEQLIALGALKVILFGSLAREEVDVNSDLDLLVIMPADKPGKVWWKQIYDEVERGVAAELMVYNQQEFRDNLPISSFLRHIVESGRVVYEKAV